METLLLASNKVKLVPNTLENENNLSSKRASSVSFELEMFLEGKRKFENVNKLLDQNRIDYILTSNQNVYHKLISKGYKLKLQLKEYSVYIVSK